MKTPPGRLVQWPSSPDGRNRHRLANGLAFRRVLFALLLQPAAAGAISSAQFDDFSDATLQGWAMGAQSVTATHMANVADGGPNGIGDNFLQVVADGTNVGGGRLTFFNQSQWSGDYLGAGIGTIAFDVRNLDSSAPLNLRLGINGGHLDPEQTGVFLGGLFATTYSVTLDSGSDWTHVVFPVGPGDLVPVSGRSGTTGNDVMVTLGNVLELRLLNSATPDWNGVPVIATLGVDNVQSVPVPPAAMLFTSGLLALLVRCGRRGNRGCRTQP